MRLRASSGPYGIYIEGPDPDEVRDARLAEDLFVRPAPKPPELGRCPHCESLTCGEVCRFTMLPRRTA